MRAYSPYHNVADGTAYPAVLLTAGEFDPRVDPYHAGVNAFLFDTLGVDYREHGDRFRLTG
jgi:prolyl oligopeptidase PreP (S9A serine peptidase family)